MADLDALKQHLRDEVEQSTEKSKSGLYNCPLCDSGKKVKGTGALGIFDNGQRWKCQSCNQGGDIYDLYELRDGLSKADATRAVLARYGSGTYHKPSLPASKPFTKPAEQPRSYADDITRYAAALEGSKGQSYLEGRSFTLDTMRRFALGFDVAHSTITIPYNKENSYYGQRNIDDNATGKHYNLKGVEIPLYNPSALYASPVCFIVESPFCAISIEQRGGAAVALSGTSGEGRLLAQLKKKPTQAALVLALDNDEPGQKATAALGEALKAADIYFLQANIAGPFKDPNERLQHDAAGLRAEIKTTIEAVELARDTEKQAQIDEYRQESAEGYIKAFTDGIAASIDTPAIPTGFTGLDTLLEGGLYEGLYIIGAISSLGKTTFALQAADQIAASGHDVIVFSLEMARNELIAKSISRLTYKAHIAQGLPRGAAKTTRGITTGKRYAQYNDKEMQLIDSATQEYAAIGRHIWIKEGIGDMGAEQVREAVKRHISLTGCRPVIMIDYLQILSPYEIRATDKQNTDKAVLELKRISRDYKIPVIGISSFNRDNYLAPVNMAAFKESGAIEYSSDVLMGLQYQGMDYQEGEADKAREKRIRELTESNEAAGREGKGQEIELKVLKNRNGGRGTSEPLTFYPMFNCFMEHPEGFTNESQNVFKGNHKRI